jgi:glycosyltransferase involved in cell wall biosynthesis
MIKVLHIFGQMNRGGAEMRTLELVPYLQQRGIQMDFMVLREGPGHLDDQLNQLGCQKYCCPIRQNPFAFRKQYLSFLRSHSYDIVHSHVHYASGWLLRLAYQAGIPGRIVHFRSTYDSKGNSLWRKLYRRTMLYWLNKYANSILAVSEGSMDASWYSGWRQDKRALVIYNGLDIERFKAVPSRRRELRSELNLSDDSILLVNVARFNWEKGQDVLVRVADRLIQKNKKIHLLLVGNGPLREMIKKQAEEMAGAPNIHFLGLRDDVESILKGCCVFLLASRWEGLPGVVLEAVAAELPVVATDLSGVKEIADQTDLIRMVPVDDVDSMVNAVEETISQLESIRKVSHPFPQRFDLTYCAESLLKIYNNVTKLACPPKNSPA